MFNLLLPVVQHFGLCRPFSSRFDFRVTKKTCWSPAASDRNGLVWSVVFVLTILDIAVPLSLGLSIPGPETLARFYNICLQPTTAIDD
ncbi:transposase-like protein, partial [Pyrenophora tritici-repentis]